LVLERLHKQAKKYAAQRKNTTSYEVGLIEEITVCALRDLREDFLCVGLLNAYSPRGGVMSAIQELYPDEKDELKVARVLSTSSGPVCMGDVVLYRCDGNLFCGECMLHFSCEAGCRSILSRWESAPAATPLTGHVGRYRINGGVQIYNSACIEVACIFSSSNGFAHVLIPPLYR
jgi:hypothetical protein